MGAVLIRCPKTGHAVATGIETESEELRRFPPVECRLHCPACGSEHVWTVAEAFFAEDAPPPEKTAGDRTP